MKKIREEVKETKRVGESEVLHVRRTALNETRKRQKKKRGDRMEREVWAQIAGCVKICT